MSGIVRKSTMVQAAMRMCLALACFGVLAPRAMAETRPSIFLVQKAMKNMDRIARSTESKLQIVADKTLDRARAMASGEPSQQQLFRIFQTRQFRMQVINFQSQRRLARIREIVTRRLDRLGENNPEATTMLEDAFSEMQGRLSSAYSTQQSRLQTLFTVATAGPPDEPNGLRPLPDEDPDLGDDGDDDL